MKSFVTGSQKYGTPTPDSDVDLVVRIDWEDLQLLRKFASAHPIADDDYYKNTDACSLRFGKLNLICVLSDEAVKTWKLGTEMLVDEKPVARSKAVELFRTLRQTV